MAAATQTTTGSNNGAPEVALPSKAVSDAQDVLKPTRDLLHGLSLLGGDKGADDAADNADDFGSVWGGPPQSVALIEAGATAAAKWWAAGLSASVGAAWVWVTAFWNANGPIHANLVTGIAIVTAAVVLAIGYLIASDVRGRAAAAAATIDARSRVAIAMLSNAEALYKRPPAQFEPSLVALSPSRKVVNRAAEEPDDENDWDAIAIERQADGSLAYVVAKGSKQMTLGPDKLIFVSQAKPPKSGSRNGS